MTLSYLIQGGEAQRVVKQQPVIPALLFVAPLLSTPKFVFKRNYITSHATRYVRFSFVSKLLGYGDLTGFKDALRDVKSDSASKKRLDAARANMAKGKFTFRDFATQFENMKKMGPMSSVMGMMPGMGGMGGMADIMGAGADKQHEDFRVIMDSFKDEELDCKVDLSDFDLPDRQVRVERIALGSGRHPAQVEQLVHQFRMLKSMTGKMGKAGMIPGGEGGRQAKQMKHMEQMVKSNPALRAQAEAMAKKQGISLPGEEVRRTNASIRDVSAPKLSTVSTTKIIISHLTGLARRRGLGWGCLAST